MNKEINNLSKKILLFSFLNLVSFSISAQPTYQKLFSNDTTSYLLKDMTTTLDGGTIVLSREFPYRTLAKLNCSGNIVWNKRWDLSSNPFLGTLTQNLLILRGFCCL